jgi:ABC-2 type transport system permease protein
MLVYAEYKTDFIAINIASALILIMGVVSLEIIFAQVDHIAGWNKYQVFWMLGYFYLIRALYNTFFINTLNLGYWIRQGSLDIYITRPLGTFFQLLSTGRYNTELPLDEYLIGLGLMIVAESHIDIIPGLSGLLYLVFALVFCTMIYTCIMFLLSAASFWIIKSNALHELVGSIERLIEYPLNIYNLTIKIILTTILPFGFISFYPSQYFFSFEDNKVFIFCIPVVALILILLSRLVWKKGLQTYQSPGA